MERHPCHDCPDREEHARWAERWWKLHRDTETLRRRVEQRTNTVARIFDRVCEVLSTLGYLTGEGEALDVTDRGRDLMRIYSELDLLVAEALRAGIWRGLTAPELAAAVSALVFENRRPDEGAGPQPPTKAVAKALAATIGLWSELESLERSHRLDFLRRPESGFAWAAYHWARGDDLDEVLGGIGQSAGDFVRVVKQLLDLLDQIAGVADGDVRAAAREAVDGLRRGIVAAAGMEAEEDQPDPV